MPGDNQQTQNDEDLRGIVASDRQQINALQDQVNRLNDHIAEMEHNGDDGGGSSDADKTKVADLERQVQELKAGGATTTAGSTPASGQTPQDAPPAPGPGSPPPPGSAPNLTGMPGGAPESAAPSGDVTSVAGVPSSNSSSTVSANNDATNTNANPKPDDSANNDSDNGNADNSSDSNDNGNGTEVASNAPRPPAAPPAPPPMPGPPLVAGSPSWRGLLGQEFAAAQSSSDSAAKVYRAGLINMKAGKYPQAIGVFQGLQRKYPKSSFSEPAEYFSANALYELGKYDQAILQFNDLVMRFPRGRFASASLLSEGQAFMKMDDRIDARLTLQKLLDEHPTAAEAPTARAMMNSLANG